MSGPGEGAGPAPQAPQGPHDPQAAAPPRRARPRLAWAALAGFALAVGWLVVHGTLVRAPVDPAGPEDGARVALVAGPQGGKRVRVAQVMALPLEQVWATLTDYAAYPQVFREMGPVEARREGDLADGRVRFSGRALLPLLGELPYQVSIREQASGEERSLSWDEQQEGLDQNRGAWRLRALGPTETLVVLELEVEVSWCPAFLVRDVLQARLPAVLRELERGARDRAR